MNITTEENLTPFELGKSFGFNQCKVRMNELISKYFDYLPRSFIENYLTIENKKD